MIIWLIKTFFVSFCVFLPSLLVSSASVMALPFLSFIMPIYAWNIPLIPPIFLKKSLVLHIILFASISLHCSLKGFISPYYFLEFCIQLHLELLKIHNIVCACSVPQLYPTLCNPMDYIPPGSSVHRIFQARTMEQVAISSSRGSSQTRD